MKITFIIYFRYKKPAATTLRKNVANSKSTATSPDVTFSFKTLPKTTLEAVATKVGAIDGDSVG